MDMLHAPHFFQIERKMLDSAEKLAKVCHLPSCPSPNLFMPLPFRYAVVKNW